ncbi:MAG: hypothetical protein ACRCVW_03125 [Brevinema sp.]
MRIYLLLMIVLILGACVDKQDLPQTSSEIQSDSTILETRVETNEVTNNIEVLPRVISEEYIK